MTGVDPLATFRFHNVHDRIGITKFADCRLADADGGAVCMAPASQSSRDSHYRRMRDIARDPRAREVCPNDEKGTSGHDSLPACSRHMLSALRHVLPKACEWPSGLGDFIAGHVIPLPIFRGGRLFLEVRHRRTSGPGCEFIPSIWATRPANRSMAQTITPQHPR